MSAATSGTWTVVVPVRAWLSAKTRLRMPHLNKAEFARALSLDTLDTVIASRLVGRIVVVTSEPGFGDHTVAVSSLVVLREGRGGSLDPLNDAIALARAWGVVHAPTCPIAVVPADLPCLTTDSLDATLIQLAAFDRSHVPDHRGNGTTLSAATRPSLLVPRYGSGSEQAHAAAGSTPISDVAYGARLDVDNREDLISAAALGLSPRVNALAAGLGSIAVRGDPGFQVAQGQCLTGDANFPRYL